MKGLPAGHPQRAILTATTALPYPHLERATAGLRAELRRQLLNADIRDLSVLDTFAVTGPVEFADLQGRTWFEHRAGVESRESFDPPAT